MRIPAKFQIVEKAQITPALFGMPPALNNPKQKESKIEEMPGRSKVRKSERVAAELFTAQRIRLQFKEIQAIDELRVMRFRETVPAQSSSPA
jgi:hypothetical protein